MSRWTCIRCPKCGAKLVRIVNLQCLLVGATLISPWVLIELYGNGWNLYWCFAAILAACFSSYFLDVFTVRLCKAGEWRGWLLGYGKHE